MTSAWAQQYSDRVDRKIRHTAKTLMDQYYALAKTGALGEDAQRRSMRHDAGETAILTLELEELMSRNFEELHAPTLAMTIIPTDDTVSAAEAIAYEQVSHVGAATKLANYGEDIRTVETYSSKFTHTVVGYAAAYEIDIQSIRAAQMAGKPIEMRKQEAAQKAIAQTLDDLAAVGDADVNAAGILNQTSIPLVTPTTGTWSTATGAQMVQDITKLLNSIRVVSKQNHTPNYLVVDPASFGYMDTIIANTASSVKQWVLNNTSITRIFDWHKCSLADAAGTGPRIFAFEASLNNAFFRVTQPFELMGVQQVDLKFRTIAHARSAGMMFPKPLSIAHMDGV